MAKKASKPISDKVVQFPQKKGKLGRVQFVYKFPDTYNPVYSNGAYGGMSTQRDFVINFYQERPPVPYSVTNQLTPEGAVGAEVDRDPKTQDPIVLRYVTTGVVMDMAAAKRLYDWLGKHIQSSEAILAKINKPEKKKK